MAFTTLLDIETGKTYLVDVDVASAVSGVASVNGYTGTVVVNGADINATVDGYTDTITYHLNNQYTTIHDIKVIIGDTHEGLIKDVNDLQSSTTTLRNDVDDLGDQVQGIEAKIPSAPSTDGAYKLTCTVSGGVASYSWVAE